MTTQQCEYCFDLFATASEYLTHKAERHNESVFMDTLNPDTIKRANQTIMEDLFEDWSFALDSNEMFYGDKEYAQRSGEAEIIEAFNKFYKLDPTDTDFLTA
jgi:hypothetical protein